MDKCPGLIGGLNDPSTSCNIPSAINEQIYGVLDQLPGDNPLGQWGVPPSGGTSPPPASSSSSSTSVKVVSTPSTPATKPATKPATEPATQPATAAPTTKVAAVSESSADSPTTLAPPTGTTPADPGAGNIVTSYVTRTSWIVTTVTVDVPGSSSTSTSSSIPEGWLYKGCFSDNVNARVLTGITFADIGNHQVTNTKCTTYCGAKGFSLAGTEYGGQCFCGNELVGSSSIAESMCNMACEGDGSQTCGGPNALSVYTTGSAKKRYLRIRGSSQ